MKPTVEDRDGRDIDPQVATLEGEAAQQEVKELDRAHPGGPVVTREPSQYLEQPSPTYYDRAAIKEPVWISTIPLYFFVGGAAGTASVLGATVLAIDRKRRLEGLGMKCRVIGMVGDMLSAGLLISDLGRPTRFLNMLRVFRPTSPMSVGSWVLAASGALNTASVLFRKTVLGDIADFSAGLLGAPLAAYTGVLIANSAVPVWQHGRRALPVLFTASGAATASALLQLTSLDADEARVVRRFGLVARAAELAASFAYEREVKRASDAAAKPLHTGISGTLMVAAKICTAASIALELFKRPKAGAVLATLGALALRFGVYHAGKASARDPRAVFESQRQGHGAAEVVSGAAPSLKLPVVY